MFIFILCSYAIIDGITKIKIASEHTDILATPMAATTDADASRFRIFLHRNVTRVDGVTDMDIASEPTEVQTATMAPSMSATTDAATATTDVEASCFCVFCHNKFILVDSVADIDIAPHAA